MAPSCPVLRLLCQYNFTCRPVLAIALPHTHVRVTTPVSTVPAAPSSCSMNLASDFMSMRPGGSGASPSCIMTMSPTTDALVLTDLGCFTLPLHFFHCFCELITLPLSSVSLLHIDCLVRLLCHCPVKCMLMVADSIWLCICSVRLMARLVQTSQFNLCLCMILMQVQRCDNKSLAIPWATHCLAG